MHRKPRQSISKIVMLVLHLPARVKVQLVVYKRFPNVNEYRNSIATRSMMKTFRPVGNRSKRDSEAEYSQQEQFWPTLVCSKQVSNLATRGKYPGSIENNTSKQSSSAKRAHQVATRSIMILVHRRPCNNLASSYGLLRNLLGSHASTY